MVCRLTVSAIVVVAVVIALVSISYPSVVVSNVTTQEIPGFETYTSQHQAVYQQVTSSTLLAGYSTVTEWYPGNPICDPASNACTPFPSPTATLVYPQSMTYAYQVTVSSETTIVFTSGSTLFSTQTGYQNIPPYAAVGLTEFQYVVIALATIVVAVLSLLFILGKERAPHEYPPLESAKAPRFCPQCGTANPDSGKFCTNCGVRLE